MRLDRNWESITIPNDRQSVRWNFHAAHSENYQCFSEEFAHALIINQSNISVSRFCSWFRNVTEPIDHATAWVCLWICLLLARDNIIISERVCNVFVCAFNRIIIVQKVRFLDMTQHCQSTSDLLRIFEGLRGKEQEKTRNEADTIFQILRYLDPASEKSYRSNSCYFSW